MYQPFKFILLVITLLTLGCDTSTDDFETSKSGLKYKLIESSDGYKPQLGDVMNMHITYFTPSDSLLYDSKVYSDSFTVVMVEPTFIGGVEEGFSMMSSGDSAHFKVSADSLFEKTFMGELPQYLTKGDEIFFKVKLNSIMLKEVKDSLDKEHDLASRREEFMKLDTFLISNNMDVMPTQNGAYLSITKAGSDPYPQKGDTVFVEYTGMLLDGTVFDKSIDKQPPFSFVLGDKMVIEGWEECMPYLNKGSVARMVLPSDLAYGGETMGLLPGYSSLVFDVEILDIR